MSRKAERTGAAAAQFLSDDDSDTQHGIGWAVKQLQNGDAVSRENWNGPGQFLRMQVPDENSLMTLPYIYITTVQGDHVPWLASQTDLLARD